MKRKTWVLTLEIVATDVDAQIDDAATVDDGFGPKPLRAIVRELERWSADELASRVTVTKVRG